MKASKLFFLWKSIKIEPKTSCAHTSKPSGLSQQTLTANKISLKQNDNEQLANYN
jgi:hypothetical protein